MRSSYLMSYTSWQQLACHIQSGEVDCKFTIWDASNVPNKIADLRKRP